MDSGFIISVCDWLWYIGSRITSGSPDNSHPSFGQAKGPGPQMESPISGMPNHQQDQLRVNVFLHGLPVGSSGSSSQPSNIALQQKVKKLGNIFFIKGKFVFFFRSHWCFLQSSLFCSLFFCLIIHILQPNLVVLILGFPPKFGFCWLLIDTVCSRWRKINKTEYEFLAINHIWKIGTEPTRVPGIKHGLWPYPRPPFFLCLSLQSKTVFT